MRLNFKVAQYFALMKKRMEKKMECTDVQPHPVMDESLLDGPVPAIRRVKYESFKSKAWEHMWGTTSDWKRAVQLFIQDLTPEHKHTLFPDGVSSIIEFVPQPPMQDTEAALPPTQIANVGVPHVQPVQITYCFNEIKDQPTQEQTPFEESRLNKQATYDLSNECLFGLSLAFRYGLGVYIDHSRASWCMRTSTHPLAIAGVVVYGYCDDIVEDRVEKRVVYEVQQGNNAEHYRHIQGFKGVHQILLLYAAQSNVIAQSMLGFAFHRGKIVEKSIPMEFHYIVLAATKGYANAQYNLGNFYLNSKGQLENQTAVQWFTQAAEQGYAAACNNLGYCYDLGRGMESPNDQKALSLYKRSADIGYHHAQFNLGTTILGSRHVVNDDPNMVQQGLYWLKLAAASCDDRAQLELGKLYARGRKGVKKDLKQAMFWLQQAAVLDNQTAQGLLAEVYLESFQGRNDYRSNKQNDIHPMILCRFWFLKAKLNAAYTYSVFSPLSFHREVFVPLPWAQEKVLWIPKYKEEPDSILSILPSEIVMYIIKECGSYIELSEMPTDYLKVSLAKPKDFFR